MSLFTDERLRTRVSNSFQKSGVVNETTKQKAVRLLSETLNHQKTFSAQNRIYDIFLSHSSNDVELVTGLKLELEDLNYSVYVDWIEDPNLDRKKVTKATAELLKKRMQSCKSLFYAFSENASSSLWMPWELGYFDGIKQKAAVLPITQNIKDDYNKIEFVGLYNYITKEKVEKSDRYVLWVNESPAVYVAYNKWINVNKEPYKHQ